MAGAFSPGVSENNRDQDNNWVSTNPCCAKAILTIAPTLSGSQRFCGAPEEVRFSLHTINYSLKREVQMRSVMQIPVGQRQSPEISSCSMYSWAAEISSTSILKYMPRGVKFCSYIHLNHSEDTEVYEPAQARRGTSYLKTKS